MSKDKSTNPKVSIITPVLNSKDTIEQTIKSVVNQTYKKVEYIIIDGGSTDGTLNVINKYKSKISKIISEQDNGIFDAMNKGINKATGEIVGIINSDDFYINNKVIEKVVKKIEEAKADICFGDLIYIDKKSEKVVRFWKSSEYIPGKFRYGWAPPHPSFFVRRKIYRKYGIFNTTFKIAADYELMLRFLEKYNLKSIYIPEVLVKMRRGGNSSKNLLNYLGGLKEIYKAWEINNLKTNKFLLLIGKIIFFINSYFRRAYI